MVIDGSRIGEALPQLAGLLPRVEAKLEEICGRKLVPIGDSQAALNVNITPPGGEYRWHYDRNAITALLYLNEVPGGETELYPNYRLVVNGGAHPALQAPLDRLLQAGPILHIFGRLTVFAPKRGTLLVMRGNRTLHSVGRVEGDRDRVNLVMAYDEPGASSARQALNQYLYSAGEKSGQDPNYRS